MQQIYLGLGADKKIYMEDVFSTYLYTGNGGANQIVNGIDNTEESMVWMKRRDGTSHPHIHDTIRGGTNYLLTNSNGAAGTDNGYHINTFNNNGFTLQNSGGGTNANGGTYTSWNFKSAPGFFDVVTYTGNGTNRTIAHSLGSVPGFYMIKRLNATSDWLCFHREFLTGNHYTVLNSNAAMVSESDVAQNTRPTKSVFSVGTDSKVNADGGTYVCYLFAGGESSADTATSVDFDGTNDKMTLSATSGDLAFGTGDYTFECWIKLDSVSSSWKTIFQSSTAADNNTFYLSIDSNSVNVGNQSAFIIQGAYTFVVGQWYHIAACRASGDLKMFVNGTDIGSTSDGTNWSASSGDAWIGANSYNGWADGIDGKISNLRIVKGTALYTYSFRPPTKPLTNVTNTTLLCLQGSSATSATVIPSGSITNDGATHSSDSPFDDPSAFKFGETKEGIIKCGSYTATGSTDPIYLGFEPQWVMVKAISTGGAHYNWHMYDNMRGVVTGGNDKALSANLSDAEDTTYNYNAQLMEFTPTGFVADPGGTSYSVNGETGVKYCYIAIRRPDGYVGKPAAAGTDVFAMDTVTGSDPRFISNFPVDFATLKLTNGAQGWYTGARLLQGKNLMINEYSAATGDSSQQFGYNNGWYNNLSGSYQGWMWKRHAGFDVVVTGPGLGTGTVIKHNLGKTPEMIWTKKLATSNWGQNSSNSYVLDNWFVWHKDDHAVNAAGYLNKADDGGLSVVYDGSVNSVSAQFHSNVTYTNDENLMMFFASVDGICKVGSYSGSSSDVAITTGFQPRFVIIKSITTNYPWMVLDSVRGWGTSDDSGDDPYLRLNLTDAQVNFNNGYRTSTGFVVDAGSSFVCQNGHNYIYYAHA